MRTKKLTSITKIVLQNELVLYTIEDKIKRQKSVKMLFYISANPAPLRKGGWIFNPDGLLAVLPKEYLNFPDANMWP